MSSGCVIPAQETSATWRYDTWNGQLSLLAHGSDRLKGRKPYFEALRIAENQKLVPTGEQRHQIESNTLELTNALLGKAGVLVEDFMKNSAGIYYQSTGVRV